MSQADSSDGDETTQSTKTRWAYTNDVAAILLVMSFVLAVGALGYAVATGEVEAELNTGILVYGYVALVLLAGTWLFGSDAIAALNDLRGGGGGG